MTKTEKYIELLNNISVILSKKISPLNTIQSINKLLNTYLGITKSQYIIWDNNNMLLKDYMCDIKINDKDIQSKRINFAYTNFGLNGGNKFYFNEREYNIEPEEKELKQIEEESELSDSLIYPLSANGDVFGLLIAEIAKRKYTKEFFSIINIISRLISGSIINNTLNEQMEISLNFYKAMKDIAKIIESQYELSYIIPLIGEMIDRFMTSHLIYIFIYKEGEYKLVWPNACKDENIYKLVKKITPESEYIISKDERIGVFPIQNEDKILGAIAAYSNIEKLLQKDIDYLLQLTRQSGLTIHRANVYAEVLKYATMDALTGLNNRRQMEIRLNQETSNSKRNNTPICCMMLDVDYFKKVNDTYGHAAGDIVLKKVSEIIKTEIRDYDIACRYGGEEFFIILPHTAINEASLVAQRLRKVIEDNKINIQASSAANISHIKVTVSIGVCAFNNKMDANEFVQKADKALYEAKTTGRNRVIIY